MSTHMPVPVLQAKLAKAAFKSNNSTQFRAAMSRIGINSYDSDDAREYQGWALNAFGEWNGIIGACEKAIGLDIITYSEAIAYTSQFLA